MRVMILKRMVSPQVFGESSQKTFELSSLTIILWLFRFSDVSLVFFNSVKTRDIVKTSVLEVVFVENSYFTRFKRFCTGIPREQAHAPVLHTVDF